MDGATAHTRVNPGGRVCRFVTVARLDAAQVEPGASTEFTWFAGTAWQLVMCGGCGAHAGWWWTAPGTAGFAGLLLDAVTLEPGGAHDA